MSNMCRASIICVIVFGLSYSGGTSADANNLYYPGKIDVLTRDDSIERIIEGLSSQIPEVVDEALIKLVIISSPPGNTINEKELEHAVPKLIELLKQSTGSNETDIYRVLANIGSQSTNDAVVRYARKSYSLGSADEDISAEIMERLGDKGAEFIKKYYYSDNVTDKLFALYSMNYSNDISRDYLLSGMGSVSEDAKYYAILKYSNNVALDTEGYDRFIELLFDKSDIIKTQAAYKIKYQGQETIKIQLLDIYKHLFENSKSKNVAMAAYYGMMELECEECIRSCLYYLLNDYNIAIEHYEHLTDYDFKKVALLDAARTAKYEDDLIEKYKSGSKVAKRLILMSISILGRQDARPIIDLALKEDDYYLYKYSMIYMINNYKKEGLEIAKELYRSKSIKHYAALDVLLEMRDKDVINDAKNIIINGAYNEGETALRRMAYFNIDEAIPYIVKDMNNPDIRARKKMEYLYYIKGSKGYEAIIACLKSNYPEVRYEMIDLLGMRREKMAIRHLITLLDDPYPNVQIRAMRSLKMISGINHGNDKVAWLKWWKDQQNIQ